MFYINLIFLFIWVFSLIVEISNKGSEEDIFHNAVWIFNFAYLVLWSSSLALPIAVSYDIEIFLATIWGIDTYKLYKVGNSVKSISLIMMVLWIVAIIMRIKGMRYGLWMTYSVACLCGNR